MIMILMIVIMVIRSYKEHMHTHAHTMRCAQVERQSNRALVTYTQKMERERKRGDLTFGGRCCNETSLNRNNEMKMNGKYTPCTESKRLEDQSCIAGNLKK